MKSLLLVAMLVILVAIAQVAFTEELVDELTVNDEGDEIIVREARAAAKGRGAKGKASGKECRYTKNPWSDCDSSTNQRTRTLTLKKGDKDTCEQTRTETKKCKMCRYVKGEWSPCNAATNEMERTDTLKHGSNPSCEPTQKKKRKCKVCKYDRKAEWSPCDKSGMSTRVQKLVEGDSATCSPSKTKSRSCKTQNGKDRCFYGPWSDWSQCQNGTQLKTRSVVSGGSRCHKKASKTRDCKGRQS